MRAQSTSLSPWGKGGPTRFRGLQGLELEKCSSVGMVFRPVVQWLLTVLSNDFAMKNSKLQILEGMRNLTQHRPSRTWQDPRETQDLTTKEEHLNYRQGSLSWTLCRLNVSNVPKACGKAVTMIHFPSVETVSERLGSLAKS